MSKSLLGEMQPVSFGARVTRSQVFVELFRDGMALIEETATYLDGSGHQESKKLEGSAALAYTAESTRLTRRLMQLAAWLLLHRAVNEGEMSLGQASKEKTKVEISATDTHDPENLALLPKKLRALIVSSQSLQNKMRRIDTTIDNCIPTDQSPPPNPVRRQLELLKAAFSVENA
jgi:regulator of CtrA degradation